jgi:hypothetical protein
MVMYNKKCRSAPTKRDPGKACFFHSGGGRHSMGDKVFPNTKLRKMISPNQTFDKI